MGEAWSTLLWILGGWASVSVVLTAWIARLLWAQNEILVRLDTRTAIHVSEIQTARVERLDMQNRLVRIEATRAL